MGCGWRRQFCDKGWKEQKLRRQIGIRRMQILFYYKKVNTLSRLDVHPNNLSEGLHQHSRNEQQFKDSKDLIIEQTSLVLL
ncbi:hypothetical protein RND71_040772 [Anisodus tanguticus]|uniref:Uncharacterized protein n=1 Tax=Anisodus tanguticus TaxID=243964 RepID=A0AAE1UW16_9SOLA|nr:hypothetical protein RND71_040772 [Anisodus tanguticus]